MLVLAVLATEREPVPRVIVISPDNMQETICPTNKNYLDFFLNVIIKYISITYFLTLTPLSNSGTEKV